MRLGVLALVFSFRACDRRILSRTALRPKLGRRLLVSTPRSYREADGRLRDAELSSELPLRLHRRSQSPPFQIPGILREHPRDLLIGQPARAAHRALARFGG